MSGFETTAQGPERETPVRAADDRYVERMIREFARAQQAAALAQADHRNSARIRELYQDEDSSRIRPLDSGHAEMDDDTRKAARAVAAFMLAGVCFIVGLIALFASN